MNVFERYELKYRLTELQYQRFMQAISDKIERDTYFVSDIRSIYYDTPSGLLVRRSLEKPIYKEKLRIRSYGAPENENSPVYLELKKKYKSVVYKRRVSLPYCIACRLLQGCFADAEQVESEQNNISGISLTSQSKQVISELCRAAHYYENLQPAMALYYKRLSYRGIDDSLRLTFDTDVRYDLSCGSLLENPHGELLLTDYLLEVKVCNGAIPLWLVKVLSELKIYKTSFSKFGTAYLREMCNSAKLAESTATISQISDGANDYILKENIS